MTIKNSGDIGTCDARLRSPLRTGVAPLARCILAAGRVLLPVPLLGLSVDLSVGGWAETKVVAARAEPSAFINPQRPFDDAVPMVQAPRPLAFGPAPRPAFPGSEHFAPVAARIEP